MVSSLLEAMKRCECVRECRATNAYIGYLPNIYVMAKVIFIMLVHNMFLVNVSVF